MKVTKPVEDIENRDKWNPIIKECTRQSQVSKILNAYNFGGYENQPLAAAQHHG